MEDERIRGSARKRFFVSEHLEALIKSIRYELLRFATIVLVSDGASGFV